MNIETCKDKDQPNNSSSQLDLKDALVLLVTTKPVPRTHELKGDTNVVQTCNKQAAGEHSLAWVSPVDDIKIEDGPTSVTVGTFKEDADAVGGQSSSVAAGEGKADDISISDSDWTINVSSLPLAQANMNSENMQDNDIKQVMIEKFPNQYRELLVKPTTPLEELLLKPTIHLEELLLKPTTPLEKLLVKPTTPLEDKDTYLLGSCVNILDEQDVAHSAINITTTTFDILDEQDVAHSAINITTTTFDRDYEDTVNPVYDNTQFEDHEIVNLRNNTRTTSLEMDDQEITNPTPSHSSQIHRSDITDRYPDGQSFAEMREMSTARVVELLMTSSTLIDSSEEYDVTVTAIHESRDELAARQAGRQLAFIADEMNGRYRDRAAPRLTLLHFIYFIERTLLDGFAALSRRLVRDVILHSIQVLILNSPIHWYITLVCFLLGCSIFFSVMHIDISGVLSGVFSKCLCLVITCFIHKIVPMWIAEWRARRLNVIGGASANIITWINSEMLQPHYRPILVLLVIGLIFTVATFSVQAFICSIIDVS